jgi:chaperone modulatory protein CbpM
MQIMNDNHVELTLDDMCDAVELPQQTFIKLVEHGILNPRGEQPAEWTFDLTMVSIARKATRLHRDLALNWAAVAIVVDLIEEREQLQAENEALNQQLQRFLQDQE